MERPSRLQLLCLVYHRLHEGAGPAEASLRAFSIAAARFREHLQILQQAGYVTARVSDILDWGRGISSPPAKPIFLTFDDGWASNLRLAWPELKKLGMTCSIFLVADRQAEIFGEGGKLDSALKEAEITELANQGVCIQSHGLTHRPFTELSSEELERDLGESKRKLESLVAQPIEWLCAPYGLTNRRVEKVARQAGYKGFAQGEVGMTELGDNLLRFRRLGVRPQWSGAELLQRLSPPSLRRAALIKNSQRKIRIFLGHRLSSRLRSFLYRSSSC